MTGGIQMNENMDMFMKRIESKLTEVYAIKKGPIIMAAYEKNTGTMERRLMLTLVYPDEGFSATKEYIPSKLKDYMSMINLVDMCGVDREEIKNIYDAVMKKEKDIVEWEGGSGKCSMWQVYQELCEYVGRYTEPGKVFVKDGYGYICSTYLQTVLDKLELGCSRLSVEKFFKMLDLLRTNAEACHHPYTYAVSQGRKRVWFFTFKLNISNESEAAA